MVWTVISHQKSFMEYVLCNMKRNSTKVMCQLANKFHSKNSDTQTKTMCLVSGVFSICMFMCTTFLYHLINVFPLTQNSGVNFPKSRLILQTHNKIFAHCQNPMNYYNHIHTLFFDSVDGIEIMFD